MEENENEETNAAVGVEIGGDPKIETKEVRNDPALEMIDNGLRLARLMSKDEETRKATVDGLMALYRTGALSILALGSLVPGEGIVGEAVGKAPKLLKAIAIAEKLSPALKKFSHLHPALDLTPDVGDDSLLVTVATTVIPGGGFADLARQAPHDVKRMQHTYQYISQRLEQEKLASTANPELTQAAEVFGVTIPTPTPDNQLQALAA